MLKDKKIPELLVPANNLNILKYAVNYGADAVYVGGKEFNLRSIRGNFSIEELEEGIRYAHKYGVKLYFTLNSIVYDHEIATFRKYLNKIKKGRLKKELIDQCKETVKLNLEICDEFKYVDGESI